MDRQQKEVFNLLMNNNYSDIQLENELTDLGLNTDSITDLVLDYKQYKTKNALTIKNLVLFHITKEV